MKEIESTIIFADWDSCIAFLFMLDSFNTKGEIAKDYELFIDSDNLPYINTYGKQASAADN